MESTTKNTDRRKNRNSNYLLDHYERRYDHYQIIKCDDKQDLQDIFYQLRYQVFCKEAKIFDTVTDKKELDSFDQHSESYLLLYKPLHIFVGGLRIVLPIKNDQYAALPSACIKNSPFQEKNQVELSKMLEVSRIMISRERMRIVRQYEKRIFNDIETSLTPDYFIHLIRCMIESTKRNNLDGFLGAISPYLVHRIQKIPGIYVNLLGDPIEYYGKRQAIYVIADSFLEKMEKENPRAYNFIKPTA